MATMKAKKGNPFEYDVAYSLIEGGYKVIRPENQKSLDLIAVKQGKVIKEYIECKNWKNMKISKMLKIFSNIPKSNGVNRVLVMKISGKPYVMHDAYGHWNITGFQEYFNCVFKRRPKGLSLTEMWSKSMKNN